MQQRMLIAGVGNIFLGDDGFGVEVVKRLAAETLPDWVQVADFGIRGIHLAYEILDNAYEVTILVDTACRGGEPGTVYLIEPDLDGVDREECSSPDAHGMQPEAVFALLRTLGGMPGRVLIVGCEPAQTAEGMGLSESVNHAVDEAIKLILHIVRDEGRVNRVAKNC